MGEEGTKALQKHQGRPPPGLRALLTGLPVSSLPPQGSLGHGRPHAPKGSWTWSLQANNSRRVRLAGSERAAVEAAGSGQLLQARWAGTAVCKTLVTVGQARYLGGEEQGIEADRPPCSTLSLRRCLQNSTAELKRKL